MVQQMLGQTKELAKALTKADWSKYEKCELRCSSDCRVIDLKIKFIDKQCISCYNQHRLVIEAQKNNKEKKE
jgi:hypothetical protein